MPSLFNLCLDLFYAVSSLLFNTLIYYQYLFFISLILIMVWLFFFNSVLLYILNKSISFCSTSPSFFWVPTFCSSLELFYIWLLSLSWSNNEGFISRALLSTRLIPLNFLFISSSSLYSYSKLSYFCFKFLYFISLISLKFSNT